MNEYQVYGKVIFKEYTAFVFIGHMFWKENIKDTGKIIGIKRFK